MTTSDEPRGIGGSFNVTDNPSPDRDHDEFYKWIEICIKQWAHIEQKLGPISKQGDRYLRRILAVGGHAVLRRARVQVGARLATNVPSRWSIAIIASDDELILPRRANRADGIFGNDRSPGAPIHT